MIRVVLADDQALLRQGFRMILEAEGDVSVVGEARDGDEAVRVTALTRPDVVLMDVRMPGTDGIAATERIVASGEGTRVLILTTFDLDEYVHAGLRAGASAFLLKDAPPEELVRAVRTVAAGDAVLAPSATRRLLERFTPSLPVDSAAAQADPATALLDTLTNREREVFRSVATGRSNREIAAELNVSEGTVKLHVSRVLTKLGLRDRVQVVVLAYEHRIVVPGRSNRPPADR
ncbi:two component transcriptional regulator, LuxR family [Jatrophihabitans endophyticus]|uniref:Two component transcriptional regulator, LuxR family n=1 Tax=Jatrophihabitans endophyticus TaxID=1206085 RepID=A0A1M5DW74_9ACTN|nr:response regulator transcription factor [Jatrophihabitans endophyticus]SHF71166.1 two component transcriptional regulator, LuxR family [Jatrophihabitans endophyticus]